MSKRKTMWFGGGKSMEPQADSSTSVSDIIELLPALKVADFVGQPSAVVVEAIYMHFHVKRILITDFDALAFLVYVGSIGEGSEAPIQALDALSLETRFWSNSRIMMQGPLAYPPMNSSGDLATAIPDNRGMVQSYEYQASRKVDRSNQVVCMTVNSDVSVVTNVFVQWRMLLSYAS